MKRSIALILVILCLVSFAACRGERGEPAAEPTSAPQTNVTDEPQTPAARQETPAELRTAMTAFSSDLLRTLAGQEEKGKNLLFSPYSVSLALAMTANGTAGKTKAEMENALGRPIDALNKEISAYAADLPSSDAAKLHVANGVWVNSLQDLKVEKKFSADLKQYYRAELKTQPFGQKTLKEINDFVNKNTDGMIPKMLDNIKGDAVMYLVNALSFDAKWSQPYEPATLQNAVFTAYNGKERSVKLMCSGEGEYLENDKAIGFKKYYEGCQYAFVGLLPKERTDVYELVNSLDGETLSKLLSDHKYGTVRAKLPKFTVEYGVELNGALKAMGISQAFDVNKADFSGMGQCKAGSLFIDTVLHKAKIEVNEQGTKAGAATVVGVDAAGMPTKIIEITLDRPFVYFLIDAHNDIPLFCGILNDIQ